jgi:hypothetical protein
MARAWRPGDGIGMVVSLGTFLSTGSPAALPWKGHKQLHAACRRKMIHKKTTKYKYCVSLFPQSPPPRAASQAQLTFFNSSAELTRGS